MRISSQWWPARHAPAYIFRSTPSHRAHVSKHAPALCSRISHARPPPLPLQVLPEPQLPVLLRDPRDARLRHGHHSGVPRVHRVRGSGSIDCVQRVPRRRIHCMWLQSFGSTAALTRAGAFLPTTLSLLLPPTTATVASSRLSSLVSLAPALRTTRATRRASDPLDPAPAAAFSGDTCLSVALSPDLTVRSPLLPSSRSHGSFRIRCGGSTPSNRPREASLAHMPPPCRSSTSALLTRSFDRSLSLSFNKISILVSHLSPLRTWPSTASLRVSSCWRWRSRRRSSSRASSRSPTTRCGNLQLNSGAVQLCKSCSVYVLALSAGAERPRQW